MTRSIDLQFRKVFECAIDAMVIVDDDGRCLEANPAACALFETPRERLLVSSIGRLTGSNRSLEDTWRALLREGRAKGELRLALGERERFVEVACTASFLPGRHLACIRDITERKTAECALQLAHAQLAASVREMEDRTQKIARLSGMGELLQTCQSLDEAATVISHVVQQLFPSTSGALLVRSDEPSELVEIASTWGSGVPLHGQVFDVRDCFALRRGRPHFVKDPGTELTCRHAGSDGAHAYVCLPMMALGEALGVLHLRSSDPSPAGTTFLVESEYRLAVTVAEHVALALANLALRERLRGQSIRDPLTNLYNRRFMEQCLERELLLASRRQGSLSIIMLDLDHFKEVNDRHGHDVGDLILRQLGAFLQAQVRGGDIVCRYGGEECAIILPDARLDVARQRAERLRDSVKRLFAGQCGIGVVPVALTLSLGVAAFPDHGATTEDLLRAADRALYRAKGSGRDRVALAEEDSFDSPRVLVEAASRRSQLPSV